MNEKLSKFKEMIKDKRVAVLGLGISNRPLVRFLYQSGVRDITGFDQCSGEDAERIINEFKSEGIDIKYSLGEKYLEGFSEKFDYIFKTPVVRYDIPELVEARRKGSIVTSEIELVMELCPAKIIGVTGSDGKSTTTTLIYKILTEAGYKTRLGGNIGKPLISEIEEIEEDEIVVLELSSFQLHTMSISPHISVVTNVSPNHLDVHKSYAEYIEAKTNIFQHQKALEGDFTVLNYNNPVTRDFSGKVPGEYIFFSSSKELNRGAYIKDNIVVYNDGGKETEIIPVDEILLPGKHNFENYLAAISAVFQYVKVQDIVNVAKNFGGVEHRLELVRVLEGVKYYNSSIDSSPSRTIAALNTFKDKVILIAGGKDKGIPYDELGPHLIDKVKVLILCGATSGKIAQSLMDAVNKRNIDNPVKIIYCRNYEEVVKTAKENSVEGDCVLLSPASTSFDMFKNFEERGQTFKRLVMQL